MTTDNTPVIRQLEREVELLRDKYRTEQSLHAQTERHNAKLTAELEEMQRLYQSAIKERAEALRRAEEAEEDMEHSHQLLSTAIRHLSWAQQKISSLEGNQ